MDIESTEMKSPVPVYDKTFGERSQGHVKKAPYQEQSEENNQNIE